MNSRHVAKIISIAICLVLPQLSTAESLNCEFHSLFNGGNLDGWIGDATDWIVVDGAITGLSDKPIDHNTFLIREEVYGNFEIRFRYRFETDVGNSGLQYRSAILSKENYQVAGYQAKIVTSDAGPRFGMLWNEQQRGLLASLGEKVRVTRDGGEVQRNVLGVTSNPASVLESVSSYSEWNDRTVIAYDSRLVQLIDGTVVADITDEALEGRSLQGQFALQLHSGAPMMV